MSAHGVGLIDGLKAPVQGCGLRRGEDSATSQPLADPCGSCEHE